MKHPARIPFILQEIKYIGRASPELRLGQLIDNAAHLGQGDVPHSDIFNVEDKVLLEGFKRLGNMRKQASEESRLHPTEMTREQRLFLVRLNRRLAEIEQQLHKEALPLFPALDARVADDTDWVTDYEIEGIIEFWLNGSDPAFVEDEDNILAVIDHYKIGRKYDKYEVEWPTFNWNDCGIMDLDDPTQNEYHCWLYHHLYDHAGLCWADLLRIGRIWVDLKVTYQRCVDVA